MAENPRDINGRIQLSKPRYDQSNFLGRTKHFIMVTDPRNIFATASQLDAARKLIQDYK